MRRTASTERKESTDRAEAHERTAPAPRHDPTDAIEAIDPIERTERNEPTEPNERTDPFELIERTESVELIERSEPVELIDRLERRAGSAVTAAIMPGQAAARSGVATSGGDDRIAGRVEDVPAPARVDEGLAGGRSRGVIGGPEVERASVVGDPCRPAGPRRRAERCGHPPYWRSCTRPLRRTWRPRAHAAVRVPRLGANDRSGRAPRLLRPSDRLDRR